uniref:Uncharacterized protein n=1 Tax=Timema cristinae TaxID=61476 RepID=A0A7R9GZJ1_TIMCR|nr:unnamed protein product [Timema cristinae]
MTLCQSSIPIIMTVKNSSYWPDFHQRTLLRDCHEEAIKEFLEEDHPTGRGKKLLVPSSDSSVKCELCSSMSSDSSVKCELCSSMSSDSSVKC